MARSNGPLTPPGAGRTPRPDPQQWAQGTPPRPTAPRGPQQQNFQPQSAGAAYQQAAYNAQPQAASDPRYSRPQQGEPRTAPPQRQAPSSAFEALAGQQPVQGGYAPAFETTGGRQAQYPSLNQAPQQSAYGEPAGSGYAAPASDQNGFGQWSNAAAAPAADARGFDYGSFGAAAPNGAQGNNGYPANNYGQQSHFDTGGMGHGYQPPQDEWGQEGGYDQDPSLEAGYGQQGYGQDHAQANAVEQSYEDDYDEEPRRRSRMPLIAAAVAGALLCGGGLAYGYKTFLGPVSSVDAPLIKTSSIPSKVKPTDPGGRKFANSESSIMGGSASKVMGEPLTDGAAGPGPSSDGAKKVQTVEVRPDGSVVASDALSSREPPAPMGANAGSLDFPSAGENGRAPEPPQVIARAQPSPPPTAAASEPADEAPPAVAPPKKVPAKKVSAVVPPEATMTPPPSGAGWVAVLASVPVSSSSQMDSLKQFADMQQKYGDVLGDKTPSVQEANLGEKGHYHRLVVGPPASRDSASSICGSLKTAGYSGCWVMQY